MVRPRDCRRSVLNLGPYRPRRHTGHVNPGGPNPTRQPPSIRTFSDFPQVRAPETLPEIRRTSRPHLCLMDP